MVSSACLSRKRLRVRVPFIPPNFHAVEAQLDEQALAKRQVGWVRVPLTAPLYGRVVKWIITKHYECFIPGSSPGSPTIHGFIVKWIITLVFETRIGGSTPSGPTI